MSKNNDFFVGVCSKCGKDIRIQKDEELDSPYHEECGGKIMKLKGWVDT